MIYVMSDLHGCYDKYQKMLETIKLSENDTLYILGDIVDRGEDGIRILCDMMERPNVVALLGNHDYAAYTMFRYLDSDQKPEWYEEAKKDWLQDGGEPTEKAFLKLSLEKQREILEYIEEFQLYETISVGGDIFLLSHAGIENFVEGKPLYQYGLADFIVGRLDYDKVYSQKFYLVSGHTPTCCVDKFFDGKIMKKNRHIAIDCGAVFGRPLGCICLDTMEEFYVQ